MDRAGDPADGRVSLVSITPAGSALLHEMRMRKNAYLARCLRELPPDDVAALERAAEVLEGLLERGRS